MEDTWGRTAVLCREERHVVAPTLRVKNRPPCLPASAYPFHPLFPSPPQSAPALACSGLVRAWVTGRMRG